MKEFMNQEEKYILEKEIDWIKFSQDTDKFDYNLHSTFFIANVSLLTSVLFVFLTIGLNPSTFSWYLIIISIMCWAIAIISLRISYDKKKFNLIGYEFRLKKEMLKKRYTQLGIKCNLIQKEFKYLEKINNMNNVLKTGIVIYHPKTL